jgi:hypothetical protein
MLKRKQKYAIGGLSNIGDLASIFKSMGGAGGMGGGESDIMSMFGGGGGKSSLTNKVSSGAGSVGNAVGGIASLLPQKKKSALEQEAEKANQTANTIASVGKTVATSALDTVVPGLGTAAKGLSSAGEAISKTGKVGNVAGKAIDPFALINASSYAVTGDFAGALEQTAIGAGMKAVGIDNPFGETAYDRALKELERKKINQDNRNYLANNNAYQVAKKGMKFQEGGALPSYNTNANVILKGVLHSQKNELGDKGIPVMDCNTGTCEKVAEIEKEELVFTKSVTRQIDSYVQKYNKTKDKKLRQQVALQLGEFVKQQLDNNTIDNSKL